MKIPTGRGFIDRKTGEITIEYSEGTQEQLEALARKFAEAMRELERQNLTIRCAAAQ